jgi:hypothetical protein
MKGDAKGTFLRKQFTPEKRVFYNPLRKAYYARRVFYNILAFTLT